MTHVVQAVFPSSSEETEVIKNLTWPKTYKFLQKLSLSPFQSTVDIKTKYVSGKASLVATDNRHFPTFTNVFSCTCYTTGRLWK